MGNSVRYFSKPFDNFIFIMEFNSRQYETEKNNVSREDLILSL